MRYLKCSFPLVIIFSLIFASTAQAADIQPPPPLAVKAFVLRDFNSNQIMAQHAQDERVEPASLTKLMTAYLTFKTLKNGHLQLGQTLPVSTKAWKTEGSKMFIEPDMPVTVDELLHGTIVQSGNDSSIALAEGVAGSEEVFAELMNQAAARIGMIRTHFVNATGLPDTNHYTTAADLSLLASALVHDFPVEYKRFYSLKSYTYNKITQPNRNRLLWLDPYVDGMKTGHTESAGFCLISSARRGDTRLISVVLGAPSDTIRVTESQKLLNYGFQFYESRLVYMRGQPVTKLKLRKARDDMLEVSVADDVYLTLPKGNYAKVKASVTSKQPLIAPLSAGQEVGTIQFTLDGKVLEQRKLVTAKAVEVAGIFGRMLDSIKLLFQ